MKKPVVETCSRSLRVLNSNSSSLNSCSSQPCSGFSPNSSRDGQAVPVPSVQELGEELLRLQILRAALQLRLARCKVEARAALRLQLLPGVGPGYVLGQDAVRGPVHDDVVYVLEQIARRGSDVYFKPAQAAAQQLEGPDQPRPQALELLVRQADLLHPALALAAALHHTPVLAQVQLRLQARVGLGRLFYRGFEPLRVHALSQPAQEGQVVERPGRVLHALHIYAVLASC